MWMRGVVLLGVVWGLLGGVAQAGVPGKGGFQKTLSLQGVSFRLSSPNTGSLNTLRIVASGKIASQKTIKAEVDGTITGAEIADLNADGWPELYVFVTSAGSGSYGGLLAYSVNRGTSLTEIVLPDLMDDKVASQGYLGHDQFAVVQNTLVRRFPVYRDGDTNANPTGGIRQLNYQLVAGEATWTLKAGQ
jgi:hypothetical protein